MSRKPPSPHKRLSLALAALLAAALLLVPGEGGAWLTTTWPQDRDSWRSMYCVLMVPLGEVGTACQKTGSAHTGDKKLLGNEHAEITDDTLYAIDPTLAERFGTRSCQGEAAAEHCPKVVDLNASWTRHNVLAHTATAGPGGTVLEERRLPPLVMWSGLPDFSYTVYDWINKNVLCPALPPGADRIDLCHAYTAWLGAALNSTHFGEPAVRVYARHHAIALREAERARAMRERLEGVALGLPDGRSWHADAIEEAERLALIYETVGQHFLQDRWALGHMISRWGSGDYGQLPRQQGATHPRLDDVSLLGVLTGILHGSQEVFGYPDPLNTPWLAADNPRPMTWRFPDDDARFPSTPTRFDGIGDGLFADLLRGVYTGNANQTADSAISLTPARQAQLLRMRRCTTSGYRQVIAALGENDDGTFGALGLALPEPDHFLVGEGAPRLGFDPAAEPTCTELWATNDAVDIGMKTIAGQGGGGDYVVIFEAWATGEDMAYTPPATRITVPLNTARAMALRARKRDEHYRKQPNGQVDYHLDTARFGMPFVAHGFRWQPNKQYRGIPAYYEPEDLDTLPDTVDNQRGMDKPTLYGFFNQASAHWWCDGLDTRLTALRDEIVSLGRAAESRQRLTAVCAYLAGRAHKRTDPAYPETGPRHEVIGEHLPLAGGTDPAPGPDYEPICAWYDEDGTLRAADASDDTRPYLLHPGYVETPGAPGALGYSAESLERWCERIPVVDVQTTAIGDDTAYVIGNDSSRWMVLTGRHFGLRTPGGQVGQVLAQDTSGTWQPIDVWDEATMSEQGGWSDDGALLYTRLPPAGRGFPSHATAGMLPDQVRAVPPARYSLRIVRPEELSALSHIEVLADGAESVGPIEIEVYPQIAEIGPAWNLQDVTISGTWVTWPRGLRADAEILISGWYRVENGVYTPLDVPFDFVEDQMAEGSDENFVMQPYPDRAAIVLHNPSPTIFDGNVSFIFAFH